MSARKVSIKVANNIVNGINDLIDKAKEAGEDYIYAPGSLEAAIDDLNDAESELDKAIEEAQ